MIQTLIAATDRMYRKIVRSLNEWASGTRFNPDGQHFYCSFGNEDIIDVRGDRKERTIYLRTDSAVRKILGEIKWPIKIWSNN